MIWGLPKSTAPAAFAQRLALEGVAGMAALVQAEGRGESRHISLELASRFQRDLVLPKVDKACQAMRPGARAVKSRNFDTREAHRQGKADPKARGGNSEEELPQRRSDPNPFSNLRLPHAEPPATPAVPRPRRSKRPAIPDRLSHLFLTIGTHNWNGKASEGIASREQYYNRRHIDVLGVTEHRMKEAQCRKFKARNYQWMGTATKDGNGGVGFLVGLHLAPYVSRLKPTHENQLWIKIAASNSKDADIYMCVAYMPQEGASKLVREAAWAALSESWIRYSTKGVVLLLGDLNAKLGPPQGEPEERLFGPHIAAEERSENGKLLANMAVTAEAVVLNGHTQKGAGQTWHTWTRFNEETKTKAESMLDYVLADASLRIAGEKKEFGVDETDLDSDHYLAWAKIRCPRKAEKTGPKDVRKKFKLQLLFDDQAGDGEDGPKADYEARLREAFQGFELEEPSADAPEAGRVAAADGIVADFINRVFTALRNSVGESIIHKRFSRAWFDKDCRAAVDKRRRLYEIYKRMPCLATWEGYKAERLHVRLLIKKKKKEDWDKFLEEIRTDFSGHKMKNCWSKVNRLQPSKILPTQSR